MQGSYPAVADGPLTNCVPCRVQIRSDEDERNGMFLFLLGLVTGFVEQKFNNPRMGLAAHWKV